MLDEALIGVQEAGALALLIEDEAQRLGRRPRYRFRVASTDVGRRLVAAGQGVTLMPDGVLDGYEEALGLRGVPIAEEWPLRNLRLVSRPNDTLPHPARLLRQFLLVPPTP